MDGQHSAMTQDARITANSDAISANAEAIKANAEAIRRQTEYLHEIRNHFIPEEEARFRRFAKYIVMPLVKTIALVAFIGGMWDVIAWVTARYEIKVMADRYARVAEDVYYGENNPDVAAAFLDKFGLKSLRELPPLEDFAPDEEARRFIRERLSGRSIGSTLEETAADLDEEAALLDEEDGYGQDGVEGHSYDWVGEDLAGDDEDDRW